MPAIYLASKTNESVVKISNPKIPPEYPFWMDADWREVDYVEFKKIRVAIQRRQRGSRRTQDALDLPSACPACDTLPEKAEHIQLVRRQWQASNLSR